MINLKEVKSFRKYAKRYNLKDKNTYLKYLHSIRTMVLGDKIGKKIKLNKKDQKLINEIALLHDIGRFNQLQKYNSFVDKNIDHAEEGVRVLFKENEVKKFNINEKDYNLVEKAIFNHNKYQIEENLNERELYFSKLVRDLDKIEILYRLGHQDYEIKEDNKKISTEVKKAFNERKCVKNQDIKTQSDVIISHFCLVFDINYKESIKYIKKQKIIYKLYNELKDKETFKEYYKEILKYIDDSIKGGKLC